MRFSAIFDDFLGSVGHDSSQTSTSGRQASAKREVTHQRSTRSSAGQRCSVIVPWSRIPGRASDVPGWKRGFKGGPLNADLASPGFQESQGPSIAAGPIFFGRDTGCGSTGCGNRGTWPKLPYRPETLCSSPTCSTLTLSHTHIHIHILRPSPTQIPPARQERGEKSDWVWRRCKPHDAALPRAAQTRLGNVTCPRHVYVYVSVCQVCPDM